jgi:hypothetical protein
MKEPQIGIEPMTARLVKPSARRVPSEKQSAAIGFRVQVPSRIVQTRRAFGNQMATAAAV